MGLTLAEIEQAAINDAYALEHAVADEAAQVETTPEASQPASPSPAPAEEEPATEPEQEVPAATETAEPPEPASVVDQEPAPGSVDVSVSQPSAVPSDSPVIEPNDTDEGVTEQTIRQIFRDEVSSLFTPANETKAANFLESKLGQVIIGTAGSTGLTIGSYLGGAPAETAAKIAFVAYSVNILHAVGNLILHWLDQ